jgi:hypothetical protein
MSKYPELLGVCELKRLNFQLVKRKEGRKERKRKKEERERNCQMSNIFGMAVRVGLGK